MPIPTIIPLAGIICGSLIILATMAHVSRHIFETRRLRLGGGTGNGDLARRLERIEQMVESTALEVERLGESNRFMTKLLSERTESGHR